MTPIAVPLTSREARLLRLSAENILAARTLGPTAITIELSAPSRRLVTVSHDRAGTLYVGCSGDGDRLLASASFASEAAFIAFVDRAATARRLAFPAEEEAA